MKHYNKSEETSVPSSKEKQITKTVRKVTQITNDQIFNLRIA